MICVFSRVAMISSGDNGQKNSSWCVWGNVIHSLFSSRLSNRHQWSLCSETVLVQVAKMSYENKVTRFLAMPGVCGWCRSAKRAVTPTMVFGMNSRAIHVQIGCDNHKKNPGVCFESFHVIRRYFSEIRDTESKFCTIVNRDTGAKQQHNLSKSALNAVTRI